MSVRQPETITSTNTQKIPPNAGTFAFLKKQLLLQKGGLPRGIKTPCQHSSNVIVVSARHSSAHFAGGMQKKERENGEKREWRMEGGFKANFEMLTRRYNQRTNYASR